MFSVSSIYTEFKDTFVNDLLKLMKFCSDEISLFKKDALSSSVHPRIYSHCSFV